MIKLFCEVATIATLTVIGSQVQAQSNGIGMDFTDSNLIAMEPWMLGSHDFLCKVSSSVDSEGLADYELVIYKDSNDHFVKVLKYETIDAFVGFSNVDGRLLVIWMGGSAFHFKAYDVVGQEVDLVFDGGSHNLPEIADLDNDGTMEILISEGAFLESEGKTFQYPETTTVYKWSGSDYKVFREIEWKNRFCK